MLLLEAARQATLATAHPQPSSSAVWTPTS
ncbi:hypothetical protein [Streptomyces pyxinicus]